MQGEMLLPPCEAATASLRDAVDGVKPLCMLWVDSFMRS
jgi:hypothetical protein